MMNKISDMTKLWWWLAGVIILAVFLYFGDDIIHMWVVHGHLVRLG